MSHIVITMTVIYVTFDIPGHNGQRPGATSRNPLPSTGNPITSGIARSARRVHCHPRGQGLLLVEFSQFLPFGLTLSLSPPTVTERNHYRKRRLAGKPRKYAI
jgi:hypothetical protein